MSRTPRFCAADLRGILISVFDRHADDFDIYISLGARLVALADHLNHITGNLEIAADLDVMADIMAMITIKVYNEAPVGYPSATAQDADAPTWKVRIEFSIECAIFFAQASGYQISADDLPNDHIARLLLMPDAWEKLVRLFRGALLVASFDPALQVVDTGPTSQDFNGAATVARYLSTESYANLCSEADQRHWTEVEVLMLIDEHLRPHLYPHAVHYSETVSGEEWLSLYNWLYGQDEEVLRCSTPRFSRRLSPPPWATSRSHQLILRLLRVMSASPA
jgi:hypothetical protein